MSFRTKITLALISFSILLTVYLGIASYKLSSDAIFEMGRNLSDANFDYNYESIENYLNNAEPYATMFIRLPVVREILKAERLDEGSYPYNNVLRSNVRDILSPALSSDSMAFNAFGIYCKNGYSFNYYEMAGFPYNDYESCIGYYTANNYIGDGYKPPVWCDVIILKDINKRPDPSLINIRVLYHPVTMEEVGILVLGIREKSISDIYYDLSNDAFLINGNGMIVSHYNKEYLGTALNSEAYEAITGSGKSQDTANVYIMDGNQLITYKKLASDNLYYIAPFSYYTGHEVLQAQTFRYNIIIIFIIGICASVVIAMLLSRGLSSSLLTLKKTVVAVHDGDMSARYVSDSNDEVAYLGERFNEMLDQINSLFHEHTEYESAKNTLELKLLQSQINPHLLYNTLDSVLWALDRQDINHGREIIYSLSDFFRLSLSSGNDLIPLKDELALIESYIVIQRAARSKQYTLTIDVGEELMDISILKLTIQPVVENAILHGFAGFRDDDSGIISISAKLAPDGKTVTIIVEDNGIGISAQKLTAINKLLKASPIKNDIESYGLYNIQRRLSAQYGGEYGLHFESELGSYTRVFINMPAIFLDQKRD